MLLNASQEIIQTPGILYRVGRRLGRDGLWYNQHGEETGLIHNLTEGNAGNLPMDKHPIFRSDGFKWISTTDTIDNLRYWFSLLDMKELLEQDYQVLQIQVGGYRRFHFDDGDNLSYSHEVCSEHQILDYTSIDPAVLYPELRFR